MKERTPRRILLPAGVFTFLALFLSPGSASAQSPLSYDFLFIHHSVGFNWMVYGDLYKDLSNPVNVGGRKITVHLATMGDTIGWNTDTCHWRRKFRDRMDKVLTFDFHPDIYYKTKGRYNQIVMFKSCFPNSAISSIGMPPGDPDSKERTLFNYVAVMKELALLFDDYPHVLFIYVTSPPLNPFDGWSRAASGLHRRFCEWVQNTWLPEYQARTGLRNVAVFDLFDVLAEPDNAATYPNALRAAYRKGKDSHPLPVGLQAATRKFIPWFRTVVARWESSHHGGCGKSGQPFPWLHEKGRANLGNKAHSVLLERVPSGDSAFLIFSRSINSLSLGGACVLRVAPQAFMAFPGVSTGAPLKFPLPIPSDPALIGGQTYYQSLVVPAKGLSLPGLELSNMVRIRILAR